MVECLQTFFRRIQSYANSEMRVNFFSLLCCCQAILLWAEFLSLCHLSVAPTAFTIIIGEALTEVERRLLAEYLLPPGLLYQTDEVFSAFREAQDEGERDLAGRGGGCSNLTR